MRKLITSAFFLVGLASCVFGQEPAAWGGNHVGKPIPEYVHGDECLFCHRNTIGVTWQKNAHGVAVRQGEDAPELVSRCRVRGDLSTFCLTCHDLHVSSTSRHSVDRFVLIATERNSRRRSNLTRCTVRCVSIDLNPCMKSAFICGYDSRYISRVPGDTREHQHHVRNRAA